MLRGQHWENTTQGPTGPTAKHKSQPAGDRDREEEPRRRRRLRDGGSSEPTGLCPCERNHENQSLVETEPRWADGRCGTPLVTQNEGSWAEADSQSHGTLTGENIQRSGWPMCSMLWNGDLLHWNGGNWSHVGPLAASMLMYLASATLVTFTSMPPWAR